MIKSRREFLSSSVALGAAVAVGAGASVALAEEAQGCTFADTVAWDGAYDVVVAGAGDAGLTAAVYAAREGATVLIADVAPEWEAGGNSRYCYQAIRCATEVEPAVDYLVRRAGDREYDIDVIRAMAEGMVALPDMLANELGADPETSGFHSQGGEYPEDPENDNFGSYYVSLVNSDAALFYLLRDNMYAEQNVDAWYEARVVGLVQDPDTKTVVGVEIEKDGQIRRIRAYNGVVLACGGFENNQDMVATYLDLDTNRAIGSLWNRGDGIKLGIDAGADLWHMATYCLPERWPFVVDVDTEYCEHGLAPQHYLLLYGFYDGSFFTAGKDGSRYQNEVQKARHGRQYCCGEWKIPQTSNRGWVIFDGAKFEELEGDEYPWMPGVAEKMVQADSVEALAEMIGADHLVHQVEKFNMYCEMGEDCEFARDIETMKPLTQSPFYAIPLIPAVMNTHGGPRRNAKAEVVDVDRNPIPHLYSAGELGGFTAKDYEGASNVAECLIFGKIAGRSAAAVKDPLPTIDAAPVESNLVYLPGSGSCEHPEVRTYDDLNENQAVGTGRSIGGDIDVIVTVEDDKIVGCEVAYEHETKGIGSRAVDEIPGRIIEANSPDVDVVSSATMGSLAICNAVRQALETLGISK